MDHIIVREDPDPSSSTAIQQPSVEVSGGGTSSSLPGLNIDSSPAVSPSEINSTHKEKEKEKDDNDETRDDTTENSVSQIDSISHPTPNADGSIHSGQGLDDPPPPPPDDVVSATHRYSSPMPSPTSMPQAVDYSLHNGFDEDEPPPPPIIESAITEEVNPHFFGSEDQEPPPPLLDAELATCGNPWSGQDYNQEEHLQMIPPPLYSDGFQNSVFHSEVDDFDDLPPELPGDPDYYTRGGGGGISSNQMNSDHHYPLHDSYDGGDSTNDKDGHHFYDDNISLGYGYGGDGDGDDGTTTNSFAYRAEYGAGGGGGFDDDADDDYDAPPDLPQDTEFSYSYGY